MRKLFILTSLFLTALICPAQISVEITDGLNNPALQQKMETNTAALLNALQTAADANSDIDFTGVDITDNASKALAFSWRQLHFKPEDISYVEPAMTLFNKSGKLRAYQIRNIGVTMVPAATSNEELPWDRQELVIDYSLTGAIAGVNFTMSNVQYANALRDAVKLDDGHQRMQILNWCEKYAQFYVDKDLQSIEEIFAPGALIISGKVIVGKEKSTVVYTPQDVPEYIKKLKRIFALNRYIGVEFDQYEIMKHPTKDNIYFVTLRQRWTTKNYSDVGTLTLVWDFTDEDLPRIQVRAWQPLGVKPFTVNTIPFYD